jgi:hypothetical protein
MSRDLQDKALYHIYKGLPSLRHVIILYLTFRMLIVFSRFCDVQPFSGNIESTRVEYTPLCETLSETSAA